LRYEEKQPDLLKAALLLLVVFLVIYSPWNLGIKELYSKEGKYAAVALEMDLSRPSTVAHGETLSYFYPLYPTLVALGYKSGLGVEFGLRLVAVLAVLALAAIAFETGRRMAGDQAGVVAGAMAFSSAIMMEKGVDGDPFCLAVIFLFCAWLTWFNFGAGKAQWNRAWCFSAVFCGLAFYTIGWSAVFYYALPLIFLRRPLTVWGKLRLPGFFGALAIIAFFVLLWGVPRWTVGADIPFRDLDLSSELDSAYFKSLFTFPFVLALEFLPWTFFAWPGFCVAFHPLESNPLFSRFLRTICYTLFFALWLSPFTRSLDFMLLVPPVAVLSGMSYWLLARRHGVELKKLLNYAMSVALAIALLCLFMFLVPTSWWGIPPFNSLSAAFVPHGVGFLSDYRWQGILQTALAVVIAVACLKHYRGRIMLWAYVLAFCAVSWLCFWAVQVPHLGQRNSSRDIAELIRDDLGGAFRPGLTLYKSGEIADLYILGCYFGCGVKKIRDFQDLPGKEKDIYLLTLEPPVFPGRQWDKISERRYKDTKLTLWKGSLVEKGPLP